MVRRLRLWRPILFTAGSWTADSRLGIEDRSGTGLARKVGRRAAGNGGRRRTSRGDLRNDRRLSRLYNRALRRVLFLSELAVAGTRDDRRGRGTDRAARQRGIA